MNRPGRFNSLQELLLQMELPWGWLQFVQVHQQKTLTVTPLPPECCLGGQQPGDNVWWDGNCGVSMWGQRPVWGCCLEVRAQPPWILKAFPWRRDLSRMCSLITPVRCVGLTKLRIGQILGTKDTTCWTQVKTMGLGPWYHVSCNLAGDVYGA